MAAYRAGRSGRHRIFAYVLIDRLSAAWGRAGRSWAAHLGPASLTAHSLMDGLAIGVAFAVSPPAGVVVAAGVVAHDLVDGANTVTLSFARHLGARSARRWLAADALAPWQVWPSRTPSARLGPRPP